MPLPSACPKCGAALPEEGWEGLCPACLVRVSLESTAAKTQPSEGSGAKIANPKVRYFGDYELLEEIARGGMGVVYKARQASLNRLVAVKMILSGQLASTAEVQRFRAEAAAAAQLQHTNIVAIHEVGQHDGHQYFSMDYVQGRNLTEFVSQTPLPPRQAARYLLTLAEAIHYAHERGILHRDLKPSNVLIDANDQPRITDFGLAKQVEADADLTVTGQVLGSPHFMPPEQAIGKRTQIGPHSDVYSLGAILYYLLSVRPPFTAETMPEVLQQVVNAEPISPRQLNPAVPLDLETICLKCLEKDPRHRYATAQQLAEDLGHFLHHEPIQARPIGTAGRLWRWGRRNPVVASFAGATVLLLFAVAVGSPIAALRINRERQRAEDNASKSRRVAHFLEDILKDVERSVRSGVPSLASVNFDRNVEQLGADLQDQPAIEAGLRQTIGDLYLGLGEYGKAEIMFRRALALRRTIFGREHPDVATSLYALAVALTQQDKDAEAEALLNEATSMEARLSGNDDLHLAIFRLAFAQVLEKQRKYIEAADVYHEALAAARTTTRNELPSLETRVFDLADLLYRQRRYPEAEPLYRDLLASVRTHADAPQDILGPAASLGRMLADWAWAEAANPGRFPTSEQLRALDPWRRSLSATNLVGAVPGGVHTTGTLYERACEAKNLLLECLAIRRQSGEDGHWRNDDVKSRLGGALLAVALTEPAKNAALGRETLLDAEKFLLEGNERLQRNPLADRKYKRDALERLARLYAVWAIVDPDTPKSGQAEEWKRKLESFTAEAGSATDKESIQRKSSRRAE